LLNTNQSKPKVICQFFSPLVQNLQQLYTDGFTVVLPGGRSETFYAVLCTVSGKNLPRRALAGFRQAVNSGRE